MSEEPPGHCLVSVEHRSQIEPRSRSLLRRHEPGETIELRLALWDTGDGLFDSVILLDDRRWSPTPAATVGLVPF